jgi:hypothetical protein
MICALADARSEEKLEWLPPVARTIGNEMTGLTEIVNARKRTRAESASAFATEAAANGLIDATDRWHVAMAAACWLGPSCTPPESVLDELRAQIVGSRERSEDPVNVAIAFGAGWRRTLGASPWDREWERSIFALADEFMRSTRSTTAKLGNLVRDFCFDRHETIEFAHLFAVEFVRGCGCGRHRRSCNRSDDHACCIDEHTLRAWDPSVAHLGAWIDQAVRGLAGKELRGAAFADGMLYAELHREGRLQRASVEALMCGECATVFEASRCPTTGCAGTARAAHRRVVLVNRLVVPRNCGGRYVVRKRWVCGNHACGSLYPGVTRRDSIEPVRSCPACGWMPEGGRPQTRTVWVSEGARVVDAEHVSTEVG